MRCYAIVIHKRKDRPRDRLFTRHWIPDGPPTKEDLLCVIESDESWLCRQFHLAHPRLWVTQITGDFLFVHMRNMMNEQFYLLLTVECLISFGTFLRSTAPPVGPILWFLTVDWVCCLNVGVYPVPCTDALDSQAAYNEHSVITVTWQSCTAWSTHTSRPHAYAETQITLFYYLPVRIIYGVITELHNESGWLFKF